MAEDQCALAGVAGIAHRVGHGLVERRETPERPFCVSFVGNPGRKLHHLADGGEEGAAVGSVERIERNWIHADDLKPHSTAQAVAPSW